MAYTWPSWFEGSAISGVVERAKAISILSNLTSTMTSMFQSPASSSSDDDEEDGAMERRDALSIRSNLCSRRTKIVPTTGEGGISDAAADADNHDDDNDDPF